MSDKKKRYETSFSYDSELKDRVDSVKGEKESISHFAFEAMKEKVNRMEKRDERSRIEAAKRDAKILRPVVEEMVEEMVEALMKNYQPREVRFK